MKALVTGSSRGIGAAICKSLTNAGVEVTGTLRPEFDALDPLSLTMLCHKAKKSRYNILINNIGGGGKWGSYHPHNTNDQVWADVLHKNLVTAQRLTSAIVPFMLSTGWGRVITISSTHGKEARGRPWFTVAKAAEIALMKSMSRAYLTTGVTFNTICPGRIAVGGEKDADIKPDDIVGQPEDVGALVAFLCSEQAGHINGACITVDGGDSVSY